MKHLTITQKDGVTYTIDPSTKKLVSKWLSKRVYQALKESGSYTTFMNAETLKEASDILNQKKSSFKKRF